MHIHAYINTHTHSERGAEREGERERTRGMYVIYVMYVCMYGPQGHKENTFRPIQHIRPLNPEGGPTYAAFPRAVPRRCAPLASCSRESGPAAISTEPNIPTKEPRLRRKQGVLGSTAAAAAVVMLSVVALAAVVLVLLMLAVAVAAAAVGAGAVAVAVAVAGAVMAAAAAVVVVVVASVEAAESQTMIQVRIPHDVLHATRLLDLLGF